MRARSTARSAVIHEDDRGRRRDVACVAGGVVTGAGVGVLAGVLAPASGLVLGVAGALAGAMVGRLLASRISAEEWDPPANQHPYVGARSPDDDIASS